MQTIHQTGLRLGARALAGMLCLSLLCQSCATTMAFSVSSVVPAAEGSVKIKKDKNSNYGINLHVDRLASPMRLDPAKNLYVVWMNTRTDGVKNIGELKTSHSLMSKELKSSLQTVTAFEPTGFFITAENNKDVQNPEGATVLQTRY